MPLLPTLDQQQRRRQRTRLLCTSFLSPSRIVMSFLMQTNYSSITCRAVLHLWCVALRTLNPPYAVVGIFAVTAPLTKMSRRGGILRGGGFRRGCLPTMFSFCDDLKEIHR